MGIGQMALEPKASNSFDLVLSTGVRLQLHEGVDGTLTIMPQSVIPDDLLRVEMEAAPGNMVMQGYTRQIRVEPYST